MGLPVHCKHREQASAISDTRLLLELLKEIFFSIGDSYFDLSENVVQILSIDSIMLSLRN